MKRIQVEVNPYMEFINSILLTSRCNEMTKPMLGYGIMVEKESDYTSAIKSFFRPFADDPVYAVVENMILKGFLFNRPVELALSLDDSEEFVMRREVSPLCEELCGGKGQIELLLSNLREIYHKSEYSSFFEKGRRFYSSDVEEARIKTERFSYVELLEAEFGIKNRSYHCVLSSLTYGNFGISFTEEITGQKDLYSVFYTGSTGLSEELLFHEYSHPFINPLTEKNRKEVMRYRNAYEWLKPYKAPFFLSGYGEWEECVNEHFVRAMSLHLMGLCGMKEEAKVSLKRHVSLGYRYLPMILERYEYYDRNRWRYADFEQFFLEGLNVFREKI